MISNNNLGALMGAPVVGPDDDRIGTVSQVFVDPVDGHPNWITVHTGLFGRRETFVPIEDATWDREILHVGFDKSHIKDAPRFDTDGPLGADAEDELYRYYGLAGTDADRDAGADRDDREHDDREHDETRDESDSPEPSGDTEHSDDTDARDASDGSPGNERPLGVRLRKYVVTEEANVTVPITHEELRVEPEPGDENGRDNGQGDHNGNGNGNGDRNGNGNREKGRHRA